MARYIFDCETDGLLDVVTKIHVIGWYNLDTGKSGTITDYNVMRRFLSQEDLTLICHNAIRFDIPVFEKILDIKTDARIIDTLALAWYLYPMMKKTGLEVFGELFGIKKPEVEDWSDKPIEVYINRVEEDVKINYHLFLDLLATLKEIYSDNTDDIKNIINYLMYKMKCAKEQEDIRWKLDKETCENNLKMFTEEFERKEKILSEMMPEHIEYKKINKPKKMYKKDESLSARGENWLSLLSDLGLDKDYDEELKIEKGRSPGNPNSVIQLKNWLFSLGWKPATFKYEDEGNGKVRKIPQINLPRGQGLCKSVKLLYEAEPALKELDMLYVIRHRKGLLKGFLRDVDDEGFLQAKISGLTNTLRFKHSVIVNLPKPTGKNDWKDGAFIRGCLTVEDGKVLCGSDMSSLEDRTKQHYMYFFDPEYVESMQVPGFDPHLDLAEFGYEMTNGEIGLSSEDVEFFKQWVHDAEHTEQQHDSFMRIKGERSDFKTVNYGATYGAGAITMSRTSGMPLSQSTILLKAYWKKNWSIKEIAKNCEVKVVNGQMWLKNPVSKFWYSLRYEKDRFSTLNQGTGVYAFDRWIFYVRKEGIKICGQFHDEIIFPLYDTKKNREKSEQILKGAIKHVNSELKLNRSLDIDVQFGNNYAQIH